MESRDSTQEKQKEFSDVSCEAHLNWTKDSRKRWVSGRRDCRINKMSWLAKLEDMISYEKREQKISNSWKNRKLSKKDTDQILSKQNHLQIWNKWYNPPQNIHLTLKLGTFHFKEPTDLSTVLSERYVILILSTASNNQNNVKQKLIFNF